MQETRSAPRNFRPGPFDYHQVVELEVTTLTNQGHGLGRVDNWVVLVPFTLPGETVRARVFRNYSNYSEADLVEILHPSPHRIEPRCPLFTHCGGCQYQNLAYSQQLEWKHGQVEELLERLAGAKCPVNPVIPSPREYGYRSKITPHFQKPKKDSIEAIGFLRAGQRTRIIDVPSCPIASDTINARLATLREEVLARASTYRRGSTLLLRDSEHGVITESVAVAREKVGDLVFEFPAGEFFQNNPHILPAFTGYVANQAAGSGAAYLLDAYCGSGLFCLSAASRFQEARGIEISESSVEWADRNRDQNEITNASFVCGKAHDLFSGIDYPAAQTAVIIDPPRKGCDADFLRQLFAYAPSRVVYVSCNPATQMRDLHGFLDDGAYRLVEVQPFDLFPQTKHLECVMTLDRA